MQLPDIRLFACGISRRIVQIVYLLFHDPRYELCTANPSALGKNAWMPAGSEVVTGALRERIIIHLHAHWTGLIQ
jgi:hypothetical protein